MNEKINNTLKKAIKQKLHAIELLKEYKEIMLKNNGKVINKNITEIKTESTHYYLRYTNDKIEISIVPLNNNGYSYIDYYDMEKNYKFYRYAGYHQNINITYIPDGKVKECLNAKELNNYIDEFINKHLTDIEQLKSVNDEYINNYLDLYDEFLRLQKQLNNYKRINGETMREFLDKCDVRTNKGNTLYNYNHSIY